MRHNKSKSVESYGKIVCAAIKKNNDIVCGNTHSECFVKREKGYLRDGEQGFVTETGEFVNRVKALEIATYFNQIVHKHEPKDQLLSEDLFN